LLEALNREAVDGLRFFAARAIESADVGLGKAIDELEYVALVAGKTRDEIATAIADRDRPLVVVREMQGIKKKIDVARFLTHAEVGDERGAAKRARIAGELVPVTLRLRVSSEGTARPSEALEALLGEDADAFYVRVGCPRDPLAPPERVNAA
jgi:hypothetical protein